MKNRRGFLGVLMALIAAPAAALTAPRKIQQSGISGVFIGPDGKPHNPYEGMTGSEMAKKLAADFDGDVCSLSYSRGTETQTGGEATKMLYRDLSNVTMKTPDLGNWPVHTSRGPMTLKELYSRKGLT